MNHQCKSDIIESNTPGGNERKDVNLKACWCSLEGLRLKHILYSDSIKAYVNVYYLGTAYTGCLLHICMASDNPIYFTGKYLVLGKAT